MALRRLVVGPYMSNCYIIGSDSNKEGMIIDPGADGEHIVNNVREMGLSIKYIVLTHGHMDHVGALNKVKEETGGKIAINSSDASFIRATPDILLNGSDSLDIGDLHFLVLHTPGHSPGGICLYGHGIVFSGDTLFNFSIGRYDFGGGSYSQIMNSIHTKLMVLPDNTVVYPGHGPESTIGAERHGNPFLNE